MPDAAPSTQPPAITEAQDIFRLFAMDPLKHSEQDADRIIASMRESRKMFNSTGKAPALGKPPAKRTLKAELTKKPLDIEGLDLGDL